MGSACRGSANPMDMRVLTTGAQGSDGELEAVIYSRLQQSGLPAVEGVIAAVSSALRTAGYDNPDAQHQGVWRVNPA